MLCIGWHDGGRLRSVELVIQRVTRVKGGDVKDDRARGMKGVLESSANVFSFKQDEVGVPGGMVSWKAREGEK